MPCTSILEHFLVRLGQFIIRDHELSVSDDNSALLWRKIDWTTAEGLRDFVQLGLHAGTQFCRRPASALTGAVPWSCFDIFHPCTTEDKELRRRLETYSSTFPYWSFCKQAAIASNDSLSLVGKSQSLTNIHYLIFLERTHLHTQFGRSAGPSSLALPQFQQPVMII
jgi:hypothetical protein